MCQVGIPVFTLLQATNVGLKRQVISGNWMTYSKGSECWKAIKIRTEIKHHERYGYTSDNGWCGLTGGYGEFRLAPGQIAYLCMQYKSSNGGGQMWYNGSKAGGRSGASGNIGPNTNEYSDIGCYGPTQVGPVKVHQALFYNRELSDAEMIQNYNAVSSRIITP